MRGRFELRALCLENRCACKRTVGSNPTPSAARSSAAGPDLVRIPAPDDGSGGAMVSFRKMTHDGTATVVSCDVHVGKLVSGGLTNNQGWDWTPYDFVLDVYPDG